MNTATCRISCLVLSLGILTGCSGPIFYQDLIPPRYEFPSVGEVARTTPDELGPVLRFQPVVFRFNRMQRVPPPVQAWKGAVIASAGLCGADVNQTLGDYPAWLRGIVPAENGDQAAGYVEAVRMTAGHFLEWTDSYAADVQLWAVGELGRIPDGPAKENAVARGKACAEATIDAFKESPWKKYQLAKLRTSDGERPAGRTSIDLFDKSERHRWSETRTRPPHRNGFELPASHFVYELSPIVPGAAQSSLFVIDERQDYLLPEFPKEGSAAWWQQVANVWAYGGNDNPDGCRTDDLETNLLYFEDSRQGPPSHVAIMAPNYLQHLQSDTLRDARWMAMVYLALADTGTMVWWNKFVHDVERPVSAINRWIDGTWETRVGSPTFPAYPSGHSGFSAAGMAMMELLSEDADLTIVGRHPDPMHFPNALPGLERRWQSDHAESAWDKLARDASLSRLGIHYELDGWGGELLGQGIAQHTHRSVFTTSDNRSQDDLGSFDWIPWPDHLAARGGCEFEEVLEARLPIVPAVGENDGGRIMSIAYDLETQAPSEPFGNSVSEEMTDAEIRTVETTPNIVHRPHYSVQLMAVVDKQNAVLGWDRLRRSHETQLANLEATIEEVGRSEPLYKLQVGQFSERRGADTLCRQLAVRNVDCFVVERQPYILATAN